MGVLDAGIRPAPSGRDGRGDKRLKLILEAEHCGSAVVLHCRGRLIFRNEACALSQTVADVLPLARRMVVDLAGVEAVDSAGLGELVLTHMWAEAAGYTLKFASPSKPVRHLFELTNLASVLDVYASVAERCRRCLKRICVRHKDGVGLRVEARFAPFVIPSPATFPCGSSSGRHVRGQTVRPPSGTPVRRGRASLPGDRPGGACAGSGARARERGLTLLDRFRFPR